jgi:hypothetical protein
MPIALPPEVRAAIDAGQKIDAIRLLRERTGLGLAEAKAAVEAGSLPDPAPGPVLPGDGLPPEAMSALAAGNTIEAIRIVRQARGIGLQEAKAVVDAVTRTARSPGDPGNRGLAPGEVPRSKSAGWMVIVIAAAIAFAVWQWMTRQTG